MNLSATLTQNTILAPRAFARELWLLAALIALANAPLLVGGVWAPLLFMPSHVATGEWWRVLTGPFVHVGFYHLALDAGAFLMLYHSLREPSRLWRLVIFAACAAGSTGLAAMFMEANGTLCGLSGAGHGLMAVSALEMMTMDDRDNVRIGAVCLTGLVAKSLIEAITGQVWFASLHLGEIGAPVAICHLGGVLGGLIIFGIRQLRCKELARL